MSERHIELVLTEAELILVNNALNEILNGPCAIEEWEFETRTGASRSTLLELLGKVRRGIDGV